MKERQKKLRSAKQAKREKDPLNPDVILTKRPENMTYEEYRRERKRQTLFFRKRRGQLAYLSSEIITMRGSDEPMVRKYPPCVARQDKNGRKYYERATPVELKYRDE